MAYYPVINYVNDARSMLQDWVVPYRYANSDITNALDVAIMEAGRIRPDLFLDLKYRSPLRKGDIGDGEPPAYGGSTAESAMVPIPSKYYQAFIWYMIGYLQFFDVTDTQDARSAAFVAKFHANLQTVTA